MNFFSTKIKELRKDSRKTQQNMADLLQIRRSTYGEYERGKILPPMDKIKILADYFGVSVDYLVTGNEKIKTESKGETTDILNELKQTLNYLKKNKKLSFNGKPLNNEAREMLISNIENGIKIAQTLSNVNNTNNLEQ